MANNNYYKKDGSITQVYTGSGKRIGSQKSWEHGTIQYDRSGNRRGFVDKAGNKYHADGSKKYN